MDKLKITTDKSCIDVAMVHEFLSSTYWAKGRSRSIVEKCIDNSICFSGFINNKQVAFGRVITDHAVFGYIADVFVLPDYRGYGIGKKMMRAIQENPEIKNIKLTLLATRDAHGLYEQFGFKRIPGLENAMSIFATDRG